MNTPTLNKYRNLINRNGKMKTVIGLAGVKTSGKSTVASIVEKILKENGYSVSESALADKLKNTSAEVFGLPRDHFDNQDVKEVLFPDGPKLLTVEKITNILNSFNVIVTQDLMDTYEESGIIDMPLETPRKIAQIVGTEVLRATGNEDIHCENMPLNDDSRGVTIVSDLRFPNEFTYFSAKLGAQDFKFLPLYIQRDEAEQYVTEDSHPSEKCVFEFSDRCIKVSNNSSLNDLEALILDTLTIQGYVNPNSKEA